MKDPLEQAASEWLRDEANWDTAASCEKPSDFAALISGFHRHMIGRPSVDVERIISVMLVWQKDMVGRPDLEDEERMATLRARLAQVMDHGHDVRELIQTICNEVPHAIEAAKECRWDGTSDRLEKWLNMAEDAGFVPQGL